ncbi:MAG: hypothetical protein J0I06_23035 [Planctomycetes bacterium]|nr:hypothetical protein [Planctomycetota bacterium]
MRQTTTGKIEVYIDDMTKPIMRAEDKTFQHGFMEFGSFDDTGRFRRLTLSTKNLRLGRHVYSLKPLSKDK